MDFVKKKKNRAILMAHFTALSSTFASDVAFFLIAQHILGYLVHSANL